MCWRCLVHDLASGKSPFVGTHAWSILGVRLEKARAPRRTWPRACSPGRSERIAAARMRSAAAIGARRRPDGPSGGRCRSAAPPRATRRPPACESRFSRGTAMPESRLAETSFQSHTKSRSAVLRRLYSASVKAHKQPAARVANATTASARRPNRASDHGRPRPRPAHPHDRR